MACGSIYDTDGAILEEYFGVSRYAVLGIAFPESVDTENDSIIEATALMNGWRSMRPTPRATGSPA